MTGTMRKRQRNVWEITVSLGRDAAGIRRRRSRTVYGTKSEAQQRLRELVDEIGRPDPHQTGTRSVSYEWYGDNCGCGALFVHFLP